MKTCAALTLLALVAAPAAHAGVVSFNSKHPAPPTSGYIVINGACVQNPAFARFKWLTSDADPQASIDHIVISIADQCLYAYHGQQLIAWSDVSSGKPGHETPTGDFAVSEKDPDHHSNLYENAPMPYFMRLTDGGVGMHAGFLPGYPASHGCVRLPDDMARELYQRVVPGTPVEITGDSIKPSLAQDKSFTDSLAQD
ncbi:MAG TPA: L,D-transpeptidase family protein [Candidatus Methylacidiphilales bacterium]|nr:L,D-transpeptidase family protein [Candidatus Methylacidiphilales bacterium]